MAAELAEQLRRDLNEARKDRDRLRTTLLSTILSDLRNREIEEGEEADDELVRAVLARGIKQREEAAEQMEEGGRPELAGKEREEAKILRSYLPPPLTEADVREMVRDEIAGGASGIGPVMGAIMPRIRGRFDGKEANRIVREELEE